MREQLAVLKKENQQLLDGCHAQHKTLQQEKAFLEKQLDQLHVEYSHVQQGIWIIDMNLRYFFI
jgi:hypothetical protein